MVVVQECQLHNKPAVKVRYVRAELCVGLINYDNNIFYKCINYLVLKVTGYYLLSSPIALHLCVIISVRTLHVVALQTDGTRRKATLAQTGRWDNDRARFWGRSPYSRTRIDGTGVTSNAIKYGRIVLSFTSLIR